MWFFKKTKNKNQTPAMPKADRFVVILWSGFVNFLVTSSPKPKRPGVPTGRCRGSLRQPVWAGAGSRVVWTVTAPSRKKTRRPHANFRLSHPASTESQGGHRDRAGRQRERTGSVAPHTPRSSGSGKTGPLSFFPPLTWSWARDGKELPHGSGSSGLGPTTGRVVADSRCARDHSAGTQGRARSRQLRKPCWKRREEAGMRLSATAPPGVKKRSSAVWIEGCCIKRMKAGFHFRVCIKHNIYLLFLTVKGNNFKN